MKKIKSKRKSKKIILNLKSHPKKRKVVLKQIEKNQLAKKNKESEELLEILSGIKNELHELNKKFSKIIEPEILLDHYRKGASLRIDDSNSRLKNPTL